MKFFPVSAQDYKITLWNCFHLRVPTFAGSISVTIFQKKKKKKKRGFADIQAVSIPTDFCS